MDIETARKLGNRHLLPTSAFSSAIDMGRRVSIRVSIDAPLVETFAGQISLWMLVNLLARQFCIISELVVSVPEVARHPRVGLFGCESQLAETLLSAGRLVAGSAMDVRGGTRNETVDVEVSFGNVKSNAPIAVRILGDGWRVSAGNQVPSIVPKSDNPVGPYFAACIGAGEAFKALAGLKQGRGKFLEALNFSLWDFQSAAEWAETNLGQWPEAIELGSFYLPGIGAVGQAMIGTLASCSNVGGFVTLMDDDPVDDTNRNRYLLAHSENAGKQKVMLAKDALGATKITAQPYVGKWEHYLQGLNRPQHSPEVASLEKQWKFKKVISCVDKNPARHAIQNVYPQAIIGGSTFECGLLVQLYDLRNDGECLKCANPIRSVPVTLEGEVQKWRRMSPTERKIISNENGLNWEAIEAYLSDPHCGGLGEQEISKFAFTPRAEWSVGFVSVASGVLVAAKVLQEAISGLEATFSKGNALRFSFLHPGPVVTNHLANPNCSCVSEGRKKYSKLWT